jgi:ADP-ribosylglycohydrolase
MSGALAGALFGSEAIPLAWLASLENGHRGRDHVVALADEVFELWSARAG